MSGKERAFSTFVLSYTRRRRAFREILVLAEINVSVILSFFLSSAAVRGKKDGDREHPDDFHKIKLL